ncbi:crotonase/enoyl-CoA hydratase family protein [soil metagenome]
MTDARVLVEIVGHSCVITIDRPEAKNSVDSGVATAIGSALEAADADPGIRAIILTCAGDDAFCAGADLGALARGESMFSAEHPEWSFAGWARHPATTPTIAAVNGIALGGGFEAVLASDMVVAAENATFALTEARWGVIAIAGGAQRLAARVGRAVAMEMLSTGNSITATRAYELQLVSRVVPRGQALAGALALAGEIAAAAPLAVAAHKRIVVGASEDEQWQRGEQEWERLSRTADAAEGPRAFVEKRAPKWLGR